MSVKTDVPNTCTYTECGHTKCNECSTEVKGAPIGPGGEAPWDADDQGGFSADEDGDHDYLRHIRTCNR
jgi:hypothetical protein